MRRSRAGGLSWPQIGLIALCSVLALVLLVMIFATAYANHFLSQINYIPLDTTLSSEAIESIEQELTETIDPTYTGPVINPTDVTLPADDTPTTIIQHRDLVNFLLVGQDRRPGQGRQRSDTMIVVTVNKRDRTITLTSFMRDMYVDIPGYMYNKMNAAYARGGFGMLCETLLTNFGVTIDGCIEVDFDGFSSIVDMVGGVDIELTAAEAKDLNISYGWNLKEGMNHLDGGQALGYARNRNIGNDFGRTERQRKVLISIFNASKNLSLSEMESLLNGMLPLFSTTMTSREITTYLRELFPIISGATIQSLRIPANGTYTDVSIAGIGASLVPDLEKNRELLLEALLPK
ncbi:MAG: LCP family protein [Oscillospiraceae bacterium]|nr:LCP family protein [Oscillospiraceae bacterium]